MQLNVETFRLNVLLYQNKSLYLHYQIMPESEMEIKPRFEVYYLEEAKAFLQSLPEKAQAKVLYNIKIAQFENDPELFKKLTNDIWEFRTRYNGMAYRLFAFWDKERRAMVVATHGLEKKTQKTPGKEIKKAEAIMKAYYEQEK